MPYRSLTGSEPIIIVEIVANENLSTKWIEPGFVEPGESVEETVRREVHEEVGVRVGRISYRGSQPWPFPNSLMLGFHAEYDSGDIFLQEDEIAEARWFPLDQLPRIPGNFAISRWLIDDYLTHRGFDI